jgi:hypothetical protein
VFVLLVKDMAGDASLLLFMGVVLTKCQEACVLRRPI